MLNEIILPAYGRGGLVTFVATKVTKSACQQKGFFPHLAFALQISQNHGLQNVAPLRSLKAWLQQLLLCPIRPAGQLCFA